MWGLSHPGNHRYYGKRCLIFQRFSARTLAKNQRKTAEDPRKTTKKNKKKKEGEEKVETVKVDSFPRRQNFTHLQQQEEEGRGEG